MKKQSDILNSAKENLLSIIKESFVVCLALYKILVPCLILTKLLELSGVIYSIGKFLDPVMGLVGLPGIMGYVWASSMLAGLYGSLVVLLNLLPSVPLTVAQTTVIISMILIAHSFPVELTIVKKAGMRIYFAILLRMGCALLYGKILAWIYQTFDSLQMINQGFAFMAESPDTLLGWTLDQLKYLAMIYLVLFALTVFMRVIDSLGITSLINFVLGPFMSIIGIGKKAIPITVIGVVMGLTYGGGIINIEAKSGRIQPRDIFFSLALMCIFHSVFEDTFTALLFGANIYGILWGRLVYTFVIIFLLKLLASLLSETKFEKFLYKPSLVQESPQ